MTFTFENLSTEADRLYNSEIFHNCTPSLRKSLSLTEDIASKLGWTKEDLWQIADFLIAEGKARYVTLARNCIFRL